MQALIHTGAVPTPVVQVAAAADPRIELAWLNAATIDRTGLFVTQMAPVLGLSDAKLDALFTTAADISVLPAGTSNAGTPWKGIYKIGRTACRKVNAQ